MNTGSMSLSQLETLQRSFINKVYGWMAIALSITGLVALYTVNTPELLKFILETQYLFIGLIIGELFLVGYLVTAVRKMSSATAVNVFIGYSVLNGITLSVVFLAYTMESIASTFFISASVFAVMSVYGYTTKKDLTSIGNLCVMGLFGIIIASVVNMFMGSETLYWAITYIGVFVFIGLIAWDTQKLKAMQTRGFDGAETERKAAVLGALTLYLDFINLFLLLLRLFGRRR